MPPARRGWRRARRLRVGAGLVSVASPPDAVAVNAAHLTAIMIKPFDGADGLAELLADKRLNAVVIGPGLGVGGETRALVDAALKRGAAVVLDADALTSFKDDPEALFARLHDRCVLTPHAGRIRAAVSRPCWMRAPARSTPRARPPRAPAAWCCSRAATR